MNENPTVEACSCTNVIARMEFNVQRQTTVEKSAGLYAVIFWWQIEANNVSWLTISKEQGPSWELIFADLYPRFMKLEGSSPFWLDPPPLWDILTQISSFRILTRYSFVIKLNIIFSSTSKS
jgi:hypothetical protein